MMAVIKFIVLALEFVRWKIKNGIGERDRQADRQREREREREVETAEGTTESFV
jgi:hypothetical protein